MSKWILSITFQVWEINSSTAKSLSESEELWEFKSVNDRPWLILRENFYLSSFSPRLKLDQIPTHFGVGVSENVGELIFFFLRQDERHAALSSVLSAEFRPEVFSISRRPSARSFLLEYKLRLIIFRSSDEDKLDGIWSGMHRRY